MLAAQHAHKHILKQHLGSDLGSAIRQLAPLAEDLLRRASAAPAVEWGEY